VGRKNAVNVDEMTEVVWNQLWADGSAKVLQL
jgi:hypothetical protein